MKKLIIFMLILSISFIGGNVILLDDVYAQKNLIQQVNLEDKYIIELSKIGDQLYILSYNSLKVILDKNDKKILLKDISFTKSQMKSLRIELSDYHKTESGNIEKNPISLALLNALNYYSMSLSYLECFLNLECESDINKCLENYYFIKNLGDQTLLWIKPQIK